MLSTSCDAQYTLVQRQVSKETRNIESSPQRQRICVCQDCVMSALALHNSNNVREVYITIPHLLGGQGSRNSLTRLCAQETRFVSGLSHQVLLFVRNGSSTYGS